MLIKRNKLCTTRYLQNGNALIVDYINSKIYEMNDVALFIWKQIEQPKNLRDIAIALSKAYNISYEFAFSDLIYFVDYLKNLGLIFNDSEEQIRHRVISKELRAKLKMFGKNNLIPIRTVLELTDKCNLNCIHCYRVGSKKKKLNLSEIKLILDDLCDLACVELVLTGGEIFAHSDIFDIIDYADKLDFSVVILTNGTILDNKDIDKLVDYPSVGCVQISLYSDVAEIHDKITQCSGSFLLSCQAASKLLEKRIRVRFACPVMKLNFLSYSGVKKIAQRMGCEYEFNYPITVKENGDKRPLQFRLSNRELIQLFNENKDFFCGEYTHDSDSVPCCAGHSMLYISDEGDLYPCLMYPNSFGNVHSGEMKMLWYSSPILEKYRSLTIKDFARCNYCDNKKWCPICPGLNLSENNNELEPARITCEMAKINKSITRKGGVERDRI